ncbi:hypothetical protein Purlil1_14257 [Purpureocillium lilacinum]|uniref:Zn(2)-C6 fungal-type domain-containing protein n=1 Tax=Purpureocillium lilacinum TaxID=33203 RepID=A0ABR0BBT8_PURLI|nr:hypothetical protein Purlil1_14257 [Purpureocillium lilacinum]
MKNIRNRQIRRVYRKKPQRKAWFRLRRPQGNTERPRTFADCKTQQRTSNDLGRAWTCIRCQTLGTKCLGGDPCDGCRKEDTICDIKNANDSSPALDEIIVAVGLPSPALVTPTAPADDANLPVRVVQHSTTSLEVERYPSLSAIKSDGGRQDQMSRAFDSSNAGTESTLPGTNSGPMRDSYFPFDNGGFGSWTTGEGRYNYATLAGMYIQL